MLYFKTDWSHIRPLPSTTSSNLCKKIFCRTTLRTSIISLLESV